MLDSVILMAPGGRICYMGERQSAVEYFSSLGFECPNETNPAEFLLDLVSVDSEDAVVAKDDEARIEKLVAAFTRSTNQAHSVLVATASSSSPTSSSLSKPSKKSNLARGNAPFQPTQTIPVTRPLQRFGRLLLRSWRQNIRNHRVNALRFVASVGNAYLFSRIFPTIQKGFFTAKSVADRTALLTFGIINMSMMALMKTIDLFAKEKPVVQREQQRRQYTSFEYLLSKAMAEIPLDTFYAALFTTALKAMTGVRIGWRELTQTFSLMTVAGASLGFAIGALSPTAEVAMSAGVPIMVILMTVGVINPSGVDPDLPPPMVVQGLKQFSPIAYAVKAVCLAEYTGMEFQDPAGSKNRNIFQRGRNLMKDLPKMGALALVRNGQQVLDELGLGDETYEGAMMHLVILSAVNLLISWVGLQMQNSGSSFSR